MDFYHQHHLNNLNRPFGGDYSTSGCFSCGPNEAVGNIYNNNNNNHVFLGVGKTFQAPNCATFLQPFLNSPFASFNSQGVEMASSPFTSAQWEELERQVLIYKYMLSSVKIPPDLLFPKSTPLNTYSPLYNVRYSKYGDAEPGRCRRTDGKKWRCSKMAAPRQRYCEHHMKRGRSRKLVESKNNGETKCCKKTRVQQITEPPLFSSKADTDLSKTTDERDLFVLDSGKQQWVSVVDTNMGIGNVGNSVYGYGGPDLNKSRDCVDVFSYYSNLNSASEIEYATSGFTNAWPNCEYSPSLDLSMAVAAADILDREMGNIQLEGGNEDCNIDKQSRMLDPVWFDPFGPLGEVLHTGSVPDSPYYDSVRSSNPATNVSSPAFERPFFTHSDESVCNSPALAAIPTEVTFNWLT